MGLLSKLKSLLGLDDSGEDDVGRRSRDVGVTVERERDEADAANEAAVKGVDAESTDRDDEPSEPTEEPDAQEPATDEDAAAADTDAETAADEASSATAEAAEAGEEPDATAEAETEADDAGEPDAAEPEATEGAETTEPEIGEAEAAEEAEEPADSEPTDEGEDVESIKGIGPAYADRLADVGIHSVAELAAADPDDVAERADLAPGRVQQWVDRASARQ